MSECVVRMEMPKSCPCELADGYEMKFPCFAGHGIPARHKEFDRCVEEGAKPDWCPFVCELPENHGRLVDAELVKEILKPADSISHYEPEWTWGELYESDCAAIDNTPTIVPAKVDVSVHVSVEGK